MWWIRMTYFDLWCLMPSRTGSQGGREVGNQGIRYRYVLFEMKRFYLEKTFAPVRLCVQASDQAAPVQNGEAEVAIAPLCFRRVGLDPVVEPEQLLRPVPVGYHGIERREQRGHRRGKRPLYGLLHQTHIISVDVGGFL